MDYNDNFDYSNIIIIESKTDIKPINIYPNPVQNELNIINGKGNATIYNLLGQPVRQFSVNREQFAVNLNDLPEGQYILQIQKENGTIVTKRFMK